MAKVAKKCISVCQFGEHFTIDGYFGNYDKLGDKKVVINCLNELPKILGMTVLAKPIVKFAKPGHIKDPGGWSGIVLIAESHISIHTFPARGFITIDLYSCKPGMDRKMILKYFIKSFDLKKTETNFIKRGTKYPVENIC